MLRPKQSSTVPDTERRRTDSATGALLTPQTCRAGLQWEAFVSSAQEETNLLQMRKPKSKELEVPKVTLLRRFDVWAVILVSPDFSETTLQS